MEQQILITRAVHHSNDHIVEQIFTVESLLGPKLNVVIIADEPG